MKKSNYLVVLSALMLFGDFASFARAESEQVDFVNGANEFAFALFNQISTDEENLFISPYSITNALMMVAAGAKGKTQEQFEKLLHTSFANTTAFESARGLLASIQSSDAEKQSSLTIANSLWLQSGQEIDPPFLSLLREYFNSELHETDFTRAPDRSREMINLWVARNTKDRIKELIGPHTILPETKLILANAIYFLKKWRHPFDPEYTRSDVFNLSEEKTTKARFMNMVRTFKYAENDRAQFLELPYKEGQLAMDVLLPKKHPHGNELTELANNSAFSEWISNMREVRVSVEFPRFKIESQPGLVPALQMLGLNDAFVFGKADFSGINRKKDLFIGNVLHKAFVEVNEIGTEAAAATAVTMLAGSAFNPDPPKVFKANRPFVFLIRDLTSGVIVFIGQMANPKAARAD